MVRAGAKVIERRRYWEANRRPGRRATGARLAASVWAPATGTNLNLFKSCFVSGTRPGRGDDGPKRQMGFCVKYRHRLKLSACCWLASSSLGPKSGPRCQTLAAPSTFDSWPLQRSRSPSGAARDRARQYSALFVIENFKSTSAAAPLWRTIKAPGRADIRPFHLAAARAPGRRGQSWPGKLVGAVH